MNFKKLFPFVNARILIFAILGSCVMTASSMYVALRMSALPWPTVFVAILSLTLMSIGRKSDLRAVNVVSTGMSAGAMVAGGLAFTIPGLFLTKIWHFDPQMKPSELFAAYMPRLILVAVAGVILGTLLCALYRRRTVEELKLPYPIGTASAETLIAGRTGGKRALILFISMFFAAIFALLRDQYQLIPMLASFSIFGISGAVQLSPMAISIGAIIGFSSTCYWFLGGLISAIVIKKLLVIWGLFADEAAAASFNTTGAIGLMFGAGIGTLFLFIYIYIRQKRKLSAQKAKENTISALRKTDKAESIGTTTKETFEATDATQKQGREKSADIGAALSITDDSSGSALEFESTYNDDGYEPYRQKFSNKFSIQLSITAALIAFVLSVLLKLGPFVSVLLIIGAFVAAAVSAILTGETGINPMEIIAIIVLLAVRLLIDVNNEQAFLLAGVVAVAAGYAGDMMNDLKTGKILGTPHRSQLLVELIAGIFGAVVAVVALLAIMLHFGGIGKDFGLPAAQAQNVAAMISGIGNPIVFFSFFAAGIILTFLKVPATIIGIGMILAGSGLALPIFIGGIISLLWAKKSRHEDNYLQMAAAGLLGGEGLTGTLIALIGMLAS